MIYELRTYTLKPGTVPEFLELFDKEMKPIITKYLNLVGYWYTEIGELNQVVHLWASEDLEQRAKQREQFVQRPQHCQSPDENPDSTGTPGKQNPRASLFLAPQVDNRIEARSAGLYSGQPAQTVSTNSPSGGTLSSLNINWTTVVSSRLVFRPRPPAGHPVPAE